MPFVVEADSADGVWLGVRELFRSGQARTQTGRTGQTHELLHTCCVVRSPRDRWVLSRTPALNPAFAIAEVVWILRGRNDAAFVNHWNPELPKFAGNDDLYHGAYGYRLRRHLAVDQLERAYEALRSDPSSRQVVLQIWDSSVDLPLESGKPAAEDIPCNVLAMLKVRDERLEWTQIMRSNDFFLGFPHNVIQFTSLQEVMAGWLGLELGTYVHWSDSLHVYEDKLQQVLSSSPIEIEGNPDSLSLSKSASDEAFAKLETILAEFCASDMTTSQHGQLVESFDGPEAYRNLLRITAADDARRRGWWEEAEALGSRCTNPVLARAWQRWASRCRQRKVTTE